MQLELVTQNVPYVTHEAAEPHLEVVDLRKSSTKLLGPNSKQTTPFKL